MKIIRVALGVPVNALFDYLEPGASRDEIGNRALVPFGQKQMVGVIMEVSASSPVAFKKLKRVTHIFTDIAPLSAELIEVLRFCSDYYHHPLGEVVMSALPAKLRGIKPVSLKTQSKFLLTPAAAAQPVEAPVLTHEQHSAVAAIRSDFSGFRTWLLHGITGSGKTEVYLRVISHILQQGEQVLVLVPEINLTPQLETLFRARFPQFPMVSLHSGLNAQERLQNWLLAQSGHARIVLGTRLAVFSPLPKLALIIVDEEHDGSFKQQDGLRYSARDMAIFRAKQLAIPVILGSATPSLESIHNADCGRYRLLKLTRRANENAALPVVRCIDTRSAKLHDGISAPLVTALAKRLDCGEQSLVFLNRRGYAPVLLCSGCAWVSACSRCTSRLVLHLRDQRLRCHYCGHEEAIPVSCPACGDQDLKPVGQGTQRIESALASLLPNARILRIDRDSTRRKKAWQDMLQNIRERRVDILVGTQILAKGHDFANLSLVGIINSDSSLYSTDFRASERLFAQLMQVAGRAGRAGIPGEVLIQTRFPGHSLYQALQGHDYEALNRALLAERKQAGFPPYVFQALLRAEARQLQTAMEFLSCAANEARHLKSAVTVYEPAPAHLARRAGMERAHLLVQSASRKKLQGFLTAWYPRLGPLAGRRVRWGLDVDPLEF